MPGRVALLPLLSGRVSIEPYSTIKPAKSAADCTPPRLGVSRKHDTFNQRPIRSHLGKTSILRLVTPNVAQLKSKEHRTRTACEHPASPIHFETLDEWYSTNQEDRRPPSYSTAISGNSLNTMDPRVIEDLYDANETHESDPCLSMNSQDALETRPRRNLSRNTVFDHRRLASVCTSLPERTKLQFDRRTSMLRPSNPRLMYREDMTSNRMARKWRVVRSMPPYSGIVRRSHATNSSLNRIQRHIDLGLRRSRIARLQR